MFDDPAIGVEHHRRARAHGVRNICPRRRASASETELPLDGSGRNRPGAIGGEPLTWDANGNLVQQGDRRFHYDYRNRLTRITGPGGAELARYGYDAFNRRVEKTVAGVSEETVWGGWQNLETYRSGQLESRRTFGVGLDEIVRQEVDLDGDGTVESRQTPLYDSIGSLVALVDATGKPIEAYDYTPSGERTVTVDLDPPALEQVRVVGGALWLEASEAVSLAKLEETRAAGTLVLDLVSPRSGGRRWRRARESRKDRCTTGCDWTLVRTGICHKGVPR